MASKIYNPGGNHGLFCVQHLENIIGTPGLVAVLTFTAIAFLTFLSSETINMIRKILNPTKYIMGKIKITVNPVGHDESQQAPENISNETEVTPQTEEEENDEEERPTVIDLTETALYNAEKTRKEENITVEVPDEPEKSNNNKVVAELSANTPINPKEPFTRYKYPTLNLLKKYDSDGKPFVDMEEIRANNEQIVKVLKSFGVDIREIKATVGPTITLYEITPAEGVRISKIRNLRMTSPSACLLSVSASSRQYPVKVRLA